MAFSRYSSHLLASPASPLRVATSIGSRGGVSLVGRPPSGGGAFRIGPQLLETGKRYAAGIQLSMFEAALAGMLPGRLTEAGFADAAVYPRGQQPAGIGARHAGDPSWTHVAVGKWTGGTTTQAPPAADRVRWFDALDPPAPSVPTPPSGGGGLPGGGAMPPAGDVPVPGAGVGVVVMLTEGQRYVFGVQPNAAGEVDGLVRSGLVRAEGFQVDVGMEAPPGCATPSGVAAVLVAGIAARSAPLPMPAPLADGGSVVWACPAREAPLAADVGGVPVWALVAGAVVAGGAVWWALR